jgi:N-acetylmuramoyl-L-alanine amidase
MLRSLILLIFLLLPLFSADAAVELALKGRPPVTLTEVYLRDGVSYLAIDDVLAVLELQGDWDSVRHVYTLKTPRGPAVISPGSRYLRQGETFIPLAHQPRFIDGRLRVAEDFVNDQLPAFLDEPVYYRNLNPSAVRADEGETPLDRLFAFVLRKKKSADEPALRGIVLDPGHGGQDPGAIGLKGLKEKTVTLGVARRLEKLIKMQTGIPTYLTRNDDYALNLQQRLEAVARPDVDALILLHAQASLSDRPKGVTLVIRPRDEVAGEEGAGGEGGSMLLAQKLRGALERSGISVTGIVRAPLLPLGRGNLPTVLVEVGYLSNPRDNLRLADPAGQDELAMALLNGLKSFVDDLKEFR